MDYLHGLNLSTRAWRVISIPHSFRFCCFQFQICLSFSEISWNLILTSLTHSIIEPIESASQQRSTWISPKLSKFDDSFAAYTAIMMVCWKCCPHFRSATCSIEVWQFDPQLQSNCTWIELSSLNVDGYVFHMLRHLVPGPRGPIEKIIPKNPTIQRGWSDWGQIKGTFTPARYFFVGAKDMERDSRPLCCSDPSDCI